MRIKLRPDTPFPFVKLLNGFEVTKAWVDYSKEEESFLKPIRKWIETMENEEVPLVEESADTEEKVVKTRKKRSVE